MELVQISQFKRVAELEHITKASLELRIAQPALSKTIKNLETELGMTLFDRHKKTIKLNENGKIFYKYACKIEENIKDLRTEIWEIIEKEEETISILLKVPATFMPKVMKDFLRLYPNVKFELFFAGKGIPEKESLYDFIIYSPRQEAALSSNEVCIIQEELVLAISRRHSLAKKESVCLREVKNKDFICFSKDSDLRRIVGEYCQLAGFDPHIILECNDYFTMSNLIEAGIGISLVPEFSWGYQEKEKLALINISSPRCINFINLRWNCDKNSTQSCINFKKYLLDYFEKEKE